MLHFEKMPNIIFRSILLYLLMSVCIRVLGKRSLGDLQPAELVTTLLISNIAVLPLEDPEIPLFHGILPVIVISLLELLYAFLALRFPKLRRVVTGSPVVIIRNGTILQHNLRKLRCTLHDLYAAMRLAGYFDISEIAYAVAETTGNISFLPKPAAAPLTPGQMGIKTEKQNVPLILISDGVLIPTAAAQYHVRKDWLEKVLKANGTTVRQVFLMTVTEQLEYVIVKKQPKSRQT